MALPILLTRLDGLRLHAYCFSLPSAVTALDLDPLIKHTSLDSVAVRIRSPRLQRGVPHQCLRLWFAMLK